MTDLTLMDTPSSQKAESGGAAEFFLGTVASWNTNTGVKVTLDGQDQAMQKGYKMMQVCRPLHAGARVVVMKQSGTYIILGEISNPTVYYNPSNLATTATLEQVITRCNFILTIMRNAGIIWNP